MENIDAKVLIVDDLPQNLHALKETLSSLDIDIHTALSGNEALTKMTMHDFAVILLDVQMPDMDGFETASLMRKTKVTRETPIIFVTAISQEDQHVSRGYQVGAVDYLFKPINPDYLISKVEVFVNLYRAKMENKRLMAEVNKIENLKSLGVLAGGIAHDFNNLLTVVSGNIEMAKMHCEPKSKPLAYLDQSEKAILRASQLTQQLLTFSRGGAPVKKLANLEELLTETTKFMLSGSNCTYTLDMAKDLFHAKIDKGQISQVIQNLLKNSMDAMPSGGNINISVQNLKIIQQHKLPLPDGPAVVIAISDQGSGIDPQIITKIFDPYFSTKHSGIIKGRGLGLAVCSSIIAKHGGYIDVESVPGAGATFKIYLPASLERLPRRAMGFDVKASTSRTPSPENGRIMIMDDEEMVRAVGKSMLNHFGYEVWLAASGEEAIDLYKKMESSGNPIDIIIMDLTIPGGMGGKKAVGEILKINPEAKVIVSSGYTSDPVMANYQDYGFCAALVKPFQLHEFIDIIRSKLSG